MTPEQVRSLLTVNSLAVITGCDEGAPTTWGALRMADGLAVCAEPLPALSEPSEIRAWLGAGTRTWVLVDEQDVFWCMSRWWLGAGEPSPIEDVVGAVAGDDGEAMLLLMTAACALATKLYPQWSGRDWSVDVEVVVVFPLVGAAES